MATPDAHDAAAKARIIKHMNAEHTDSIRRYLEAFKAQSFFQVRNARMTDITHTHIVLSSSGQTHTIPFDPPLSSLSDARTRLVALDQSASHLLGRSSLSLRNTRYIPPYVRLGHLFNFTHGLIVWTVCCRAANFQPGSLVYDTVLSGVPRVAGWCAALQPWYFTVVVAFHLVEAGIMVGRLEKHGLNPLDGVWWAWAGSALVEGFTSFARLEGVLDKRRREGEAKTR